MQGPSMEQNDANEKAAASLLAGTDYYFLTYYDRSLEQSTKNHTQLLNYVFISSF